MKPYTPKQIRKYKSEDTIQERKDYAINSMNNIIDPSLLLNKSRFFSSLGMDIDDYVESNWGFGRPIAGTGVLPNKGENHVLVLVFNFGSNYYGEEGLIFPGQTIEAVERAFNGFGNKNEYPYESVRNYYLRSSYGKQDIKADVYGWITLPEIPYGWFDDVWRMNYGGSNAVFDWFIQNHPLAGEIDWEKYDNDHDGYIEGLYLIWNWYDMGWASQWWPQFQPSGTFGTWEIDNIRVVSCIWSWYSRLMSSQYSYDPHTDIHETGHLLGLPDLYDYSLSIGPGGGVGGLDMMDWNWGDHNCYSKFLLDWLEPEIIFPFRNNTARTIELRPSSLYPDAVIIMPDNTQIDPYDDLFMVEYRKKGAGNDPNIVLEGSESTWPWPGDGLLIWHVDGTINSNNGQFGYDNSYTIHKYLKLMEADGLNEILNREMADADDFWQENDVFDDNSNPNAWIYIPFGGEGYHPSGVKIDQITLSGGDSMSARFNVVRT